MIRLACRRSGLVLILLLSLELPPCAWAGSLEDGKAAYDKRDYATAIETWRPLAEQGNAKAQYAMGQLYLQGAGVPRDLASASEWFRKAAEQGYALAQRRLGDRYDFGQGVPRDVHEAMKWYRKAADQDDAQAQIAIAIIYSSGSEVPRDAEEASKWLRKAAERGNSAAEAMLGSLYAEGRGIPRDMAAAVSWFEKSAEHGNAVAASRLAHILSQGGDGVEQDGVQAYKWYTILITRWPAGPREVLLAGRTAIAGRLSPDQIQQAEELARRWKPMPAPETADWLTGAH